jgi:hypothetical protein
MTPDTFSQIIKEFDDGPSLFWRPFLADQDLESDC